MLTLMMWGTSSAPAGGAAGTSEAAAAETATATQVRGSPVPTTATREREAFDLAIVIESGSGRTTVLRSGQAAFTHLWRLLRPDYTGTERVPQAWADGSYPPVDFTVIWGLTGVGGWPQTNRAPGGDVAVERQDQLMVAADGTPWIRTDPAPDVQDDDIRWHRAPRSVFVDLEREKVLAGLGGSPPAGGRGEDGATAREAAGDEDGRGSRWWAVPGLAVGLVAGAGGALLIRRAAARPGAGPPREEPRQELIDL